MQIKSGERKPLLTRIPRLLCPISGDVYFQDDMTGSVLLWRNDSEGASSIALDTTPGRNLNGQRSIKCTAVGESYAKAGLYIMGDPPSRRIGFEVKVMLTGVYANYLGSGIGFEWFDGSLRHYCLVHWRPYYSDAMMWNTLTTVFSGWQPTVDRWTPFKFVFDLDAHTLLRCYRGHTLVAQNIAYSVVADARTPQWWPEFEINAFATYTGESWWADCIITFNEP